MTPQMKELLSAENQHEISKNSGIIAHDAHNYREWPGAKVPYSFSTGFGESSSILTLFRMGGSILSFFFQYNS